MIRLAVLLLCCLLGAQAAIASPRDDLLAADHRFSRLSAARGWGYAVLALAANDARLIGPDGQAIRGRAQALRNLARRRREGFDWEPEAATVSADGKIGWTEGRWRQNAPGSGTTGHYLSVWARGRDGWKVQTSISAADPRPMK